MIPFSAKVSQPVGSRLNFPIRVDDGPVRARLIQDPEPSPDGKHLAFSALTRLYLMDLPDGKPRAALGRGMRASSTRRWSPDGKWLAYVSWAPEGGHIWKRPGDGNGRADPADAGRRRSIATRSGRPTASGSWPFARRGASTSRTRWTSAPTAGLDLVWVPADGGDATLISPARGASRPHFAGAADRIYVTTPQGLVSMRFDGTDRRTHLARRRQDGLFARRARARRRDPAPSRRPMGAGPRHQPALRAGAARVRRRGAQGLRPRADRAAQEAHRHRRRLRRLGRRRQDDHLGRRRELLPPAVRLGRLPAARRPRRTRRTRRPPRPRRSGRSPSPRRSPSSSSGRGTGRAGRSCSAGPRSSRCAATR